MVVRFLRWLMPNRYSVESIAARRAHEKRAQELAEKVAIDTALDRYWNKW